MPSSDPDSSSTHRAVPKGHSGAVKSFASLVTRDAQTVGHRLDARDCRTRRKPTGGCQSCHLTKGSRLQSFPRTRDGAAVFHRANFQLFALTNCPVLASNAVLTKTKGRVFMTTTNQS